MIKLMKRLLRLQLQKHFIIISVLGFFLTSCVNIIYPKDVILPHSKKHILLLTTFGDNVQIYQRNFFLRRFPTKINTEEFNKSFNQAMVQKFVKNDYHVSTIVLPVKNSLNSSSVNSIENKKYLASLVHGKAIDVIILFVNHTDYGYMLDCDSDKNSATIAINSILYEIDPHDFHVIETQYTGPNYIPLADYNICAKPDHVNENTLSSLLQKNTNLFVQPMFKSYQEMMDSLAIGFYLLGGDKEFESIMKKHKNEFLS